MEKITYTLNDNATVVYRYANWKNPAGEIYVIGNFCQYLALVNSASTGYSRKLCKSMSAAHAWIEKKLREEFPTKDLTFGFVF